jgi:hypothetical protein
MASILWSSPILCPFCDNQPSPIIRIHPNKERGFIMGYSCKEHGDFVLYDKEEGSLIYLKNPENPNQMMRFLAYETLFRMETEKYKRREKHRPRKKKVAFNDH